MDFITITKKASAQVKFLISELPSDIGLRLAVKGGGCSGLSYDLDFTSGEEKDTVFENDGYKIFMDAKSMIYLKGLQMISQPNGKKENTFLSKVEENTKSTNVSM